MINFHVGISLASPKQGAHDIGSASLPGHMATGDDDSRESWRERLSDGFMVAE